MHVIIYGPYTEVIEQLIEGDIDEIDVEIEIGRIRTGKATGIDNITPEFIKYGGKELIKYITKICQRAWNENRIPNEWRKNIIIPIHKKGNSNDCNNYRAICLPSVMYKISTRKLERRLRRVVEVDMEEEQAAFSPGRHTQDQIFTIRVAGEKN